MICVTAVVFVKEKYNFKCSRQDVGKHERSAVYMYNVQ